MNESSQVINKSFEEYFLKYNISEVISKVKTLSKGELNFVYKYFEKNKPKSMLEFGVQKGCSTYCFLKLAEYFEYDMSLHCWDIRDSIIYPDRSKFSLHIEDVSEKAQDIINYYEPDFIFLDAHPYYLTKNFMEECLSKKINFMCHDVALNLIERCRKESNNFTKKEAYTTWEAYLIGELIDKSLWEKDFFENDKFTAICNRDKYGIFILEHK